MSKYYHFRQNSSGGSFDLDENLDINVVIKANSAKEANTKLAIINNITE